jgi:hypothetical protein
VVWREQIVKPGFSQDETMPSFCDTNKTSEVSSKAKSTWNRLEFCWFEAFSLALRLPKSERRPFERHWFSPNTVQLAGRAPMPGGPSAEFILSKVEGLRTGVGAASAALSKPYWV